MDKLRRGILEMSINDMVEISRNKAKFNALLKLRDDLDRAIEEIRKIQLRESKKE